MSRPVHSLPLPLVSRPIAIVRIAGHTEEPPCPTPLP